jgi:hypothetical protein
MHYAEPDNDDDDMEKNCTHKNSGKICNILQQHAGCTHLDVTWKDSRNVADAACLSVYMGFFYLVPIPTIPRVSTTALYMFLGDCVCVCSAENGKRCNIVV